MPTLVILTTSQSPLPIRHPHPPTPHLILPALVHRALHTALDASPPSLSTSACAGSITIPHPDVIGRHEEGDNDVEVTVKLHLSRSAATTSISTASEDGQGEVTTTMLEWINEAMNALASAKGIQRADTLLLGFQGVDYRGERISTDSSSTNSNGKCGEMDLKTPSSSSSSSSSTSASVTNGETIPVQLQSDIKKVWSGVSQQISSNKVGAWGTLYFPQSLLEELIPIRKPKANALDTPDCHTLPQSYWKFARENGIELWAGGGGEGSDPLPSAELHNILQEFASQLPKSFHIPSGLSELIPLSADGSKYEGQPAVTVRWVLSYAMFSRSRNVVKDKGYMICATL